ncbi:hypothetical protein M0Q97_02280 [Candidatus Dojkabacteria bacterium]|jgi:hypothetical protein|nr:hypothetical protein [Candidatus Dojkabacteria bacterium]
MNLVVNKKVLYIAIALGYIIMGIIIFIGFNRIQNLKDKNSIMSQNLLNSKFEIDSIKNKNGEYHKVINGLLLEKNELKDFNSKLVEDIKNLNIKLKNVGSITKIQYEYIYNIDTIEIIKFSDSIFKAEYKDNWLFLSEKIETFNQGKDIKIDSINIILSDSLLIVSDIKYKGCWFWKKAKSVKLHIQSENPYIKLNRFEYYDLTKRR